MKKHLLTFALVGLFGSFVLAGNAEACHKKKCGHAAPVCEPAPVVCEPAPAPVCEPVACAPKKHCFSGLKLGGCFKGLKLGHGHKNMCGTPAPVCGEMVAYSAPVSYSAPVYSTPQGSAQH